MKSICVYLGSSPGHNAILDKSILELSRLITEHNTHLIYGGSRFGLMGKLAKSVLDNGGQVTGIISRSLLDKEKPLDTLSELIITDTIQERKLLFQQKASAFMVLPGGIGTLEEAFEVWNGIKVGTLKTPIGFFNPNDFYAKLFDFITQCEEAGFVTPSQTNIPFIDDNIADLFFKLKQQVNVATIGV